MDVLANGESAAVLALLLVEQNSTQNAKTSMNMKKEKETPVCYTRVNAQNYLIAEKGAEIAVVTYTQDGIQRSENVPYEDLFDLCDRIWHGINWKQAYNQDPTTVRLPNGDTYGWNDTLAHYCYAKGRVSESEFVEYHFSEENKL